MSASVPTSALSNSFPQSGRTLPKGMFGSDELPAVYLMTNSFETGGSERQFVTLARALNRQSFQVHVGCIQKVGGFVEGFEDCNEFPLGGNLYGPTAWGMRLRLRRELKRKNVAIAHAFDFYTNLTLVPAARWAGVPVVIGSQRQMGDLLSSAKAQAQLAALRFCDRVVCNSRAAAERLAEQGIRRRKLVVIGNGLPDEVFVPAKPAMLKRENVLRVGMIARMNTPAKNHSVFLQAAARVASRFPDVEFVFAGDGPLRGALEAESLQLGLQSRVHFLGDRRDVPAVLASLDVSVLPSDTESLSNTILESMAAGVPVIASNVGGNPELLGDGRGVLIEPHDEQRLAEAMTGLVSNAALRADLAGRARRFTQENFTVENMQRRHEELYAELLAEKNWRPRAVSFAERSGDSRLRVGIVAASLRYVGGQSVQADLLVRNWKNDTCVEAKLIEVDPVLPSGLRWVERIPGLRTLVRQPLYVRDLWKGLRDADIAHVFSASYWSFLIAPVPAWLVARWLGKKVLIHYHSGEARDHLQRFRTARPVLGRVDKLVVPSGYLVDVFREFGLDANAIPNILDLAQFRFRRRSSLRPHLVCTRGFHPYYAVDVVVRAFAEVQKAYPEARLDLVGGGPEEERIRALVKEFGLANVNFAGVVSRSEIGRYYDATDIFINASRLDNMPVSVMEAFASGTPVVTTAPEGMRYLVEDGRTGLLCEPEDASALAKNVVRLLRDPELAESIALNAYERSKRYEWSAVREQWLAVYESLHRGSGQLIPQVATVA